MLLCAGSALAQHVITLDKVPEVVQQLTALQAHTPLPCEVEPIKPALNFGFRFQDAIEQSVRHMKGKVVAISSPDGFSKAIVNMEQPNGQ